MDSVPRLGGSVKGGGRSVASASSDRQTHSWKPKLVLFDSLFQPRSDPFPTSSAPSHTAQKLKEQTIAIAPWRGEGSRRRTRERERKRGARVVICAAVSQSVSHWRSIASVSQSVRRRKGRLKRPLPSFLPPFPSTSTSSSSYSKGRVLHDFQLHLSCICKGIHETASWCLREKNAKKITSPLGGTIQSLKLLSRN